MSQHQSNWNLRSPQSVDPSRRVMVFRPRDQPPTRTGLPQWATILDIRLRSHFKDNKSISPRTRYPNRRNCKPRHQPLRRRTCLTYPRTINAAPSPRRTSSRPTRASCTIALSNSLRRQLQCKPRRMGWRPPRTTIPPQAGSGSLPSSKSRSSKSRPPQPSLRALVDGGTRRTSSALFPGVAARLRVVSTYGAICGLTLKNGRMFANGLAARRALRDSMTASVTRRFTPRSRRATSASAARRLSVVWTHLIDTCVPMEVPTVDRTTPSLHKLQ